MKRLKQRLSALAVVGALLGGGLVTVAAVPASAHTPTASATCEALTVEASYYETKPGTPDTTKQELVKAEVPAQPAVYGERPLITPAVEGKPAVYETEYEYSHADNGNGNSNKTRWEREGWNAGDNGKGWVPTGNTRQGKLISPAVPAQEAVYGPAPLIKAEVPYQPAEYKTVVVPGTPADSTPNTVVVTINGQQVASEKFGTSYSKKFNFADKTVANNWSVTITAWNDPQGYKGWTKTISGTTEPCAPVTVPPRHNANGEATCAAATVTLYNQEYKGEVSLTASFVVYVDGKFYNAYAVESGKSQTLQFTFPEDSGNHSIIVRTGSSQGDEFVYRQDVLNTDCIGPEPETKVEFSEWVDGEYECTATEVPQTRTKTVTTYELVDGKWVAQEPVVTTETQTRPLTEAEQEAADIECAGPQPENKVTETDWVTGEYECGDTTVQITRQVTSTEYVREGATWVEGESVTVTQTETRDLTAEEIAELECPVVVPPVETCADFESQEDAQAAFDSDPVKYAGLDGDKDGIACESVVTPPVTPTPTPVVPAKVTETGDTLAQTGGAFPLTLAGLAALLLAGGALLTKRRQA